MRPRLNPNLIVRPGRTPYRPGDLHRRVQPAITIGLTEILHRLQARRAIPGATSAPITDHTRTCIAFGYAGWGPGLSERNALRFLVHHPGRPDSGFRRESGHRLAGVHETPHPGPLTAPGPVLRCFGHIADLNRTLQQWRCCRKQTTSRSKRPSATCRFNPSATRGNGIPPAAGVAADLVVFVIDVLDFNGAWTLTPQVYLFS